MRGLTSPRLLLRRDQRGILMSSPLALISAGAVLLAGVAYFVTAPDHPREVELAGPPPRVEPQVSIAPVPVKEPVRDPVVRRDGIYVVVFNNSSLKGLAARTAATLTDTGWNVVGSDNWYGNIPASTVYYPEFPASLRDAARVLASDLGIERVRPAVEPMQMDRLTVILTGE